MSQHASHTVANDNVRKMVWIKLVHFGQLLAQSQRGIENRIAGRIPEDPGLVPFPNLRVLLKTVDSFDPREWTRHKSMHEDDRNPAGIIRLKKIQPRFLHPIAASQGA